MQLAIASRRISTAENNESENNYYRVANIHTAQRALHIHHSSHYVLFSYSLCVVMVDCWNNRDRVHSIVMPAAAAKTNASKRLWSHCWVHTTQSWRYWLTSNAVSKCLSVCTVHVSWPHTHFDKRFDGLSFVSVLCMQCMQLEKRMQSRLSATWNLCHVTRVREKQRSHY